MLEVLNDTRHSNISIRNVDKNVIIFSVLQQGKAIEDVSSCELCSDDNRVSIKRFSIKYYFLNTFENDVSQL